APDGDAATATPDEESTPTTAPPATTPEPATGAAAAGDTVPTAPDLGGFVPAQGDDVSITAQEAVALAREVFEDAALPEDPPGDIPVVLAVETPRGLEFVARDVDDVAEAAAFIDGADDTGGEVVAASYDHPVQAFDGPVETAEPVDALGTATLADAVAAASSNDPLRYCQWQLEAAKTTFDAASTLATGAGEIVAVIDTGVDASHPDLAGALVGGQTFLVPGVTAHVLPTDPDYDYYWNPTYDPNGHGTHVGAIIGARRDNAVGIVGLAPGVKIMPIKVLNDAGSGTSSDVAQGITWATDNGATVINLSLGGTGYSSVVKAAVDHALAAGVTVVAAAGNSGPNSGPIYPAAYDGVIGVGALDRDLGPATFSAYADSHPYVDISAPGVDICSAWTTTPREPFGGQYAVVNGTSQATPHVAAAAALLLEPNAGIAPDDVTAQLEATAFDVWAGGNDNVTGFGNVDPETAIAGLGTNLPDADHHLVGDFDGDGWDDILLYNEGGVADELWRRRPGGVGFTIYEKTINGVYTPVVGDFDANGYDDILWYSPGSGADYLWRHFASGVHSSYTVINGTYEPVVGDFDANGYDDILWYAAGGRLDYYWYYHGSGFVSRATRINGVYTPVVGDFDANGYDDILWYSPGRGADYLWRHFASGLRSSYTVINGVYDPVVGDYDGNGYDDIVWYRPGATGVWYYVRGGYRPRSNPEIVGDFLPLAGQFFSYQSAEDVIWHTPERPDPVWHGIPNATFALRYLDSTR
ncbi:MAG: S8 family serine peptidase, partial [Actinomycetota bacterium]|nr:S8 family serine peptidase [Actinomycetota bacterium]